MIKRITIGFSRAKSKFALFSLLIRFFEDTEYSHVYLRFHDERSDEEIIYQASGLVVNFESLEHFKTHAIIVDEFDIYISEADYRLLWQFMVPRLGRRYSMNQIYFLLIKRFFPRSKWKGNKDEEFICSELIASILERFVGAKFDVPIDQITPKVVHQFLSSIKYL